MPIKPRCQGLGRAIFVTFWIPGQLTQELVESLSGALVVEQF